jgi:hypothetical protein
MEVENLTTGEDSPQVNVEEQTQPEVETVVEEQVEETPVDTTTDSEYKTAYDSVWDKDINDDGVLDSIPVQDTTEVTPEVFNTEIEDTSTNGTNNSIGAFMTEKPVLKYKGKDIPIDSADELISLAQKGFRMETEAAAIKPKKKVLQVVDGIPLEVLQAVADLHSGNAGAIDYLKSEYGIKDHTADNDNLWGNDSDTSDSQENKSYSPEVTPDDPVSDYFTEYASSNQVGAAKVNEIYSELDDSFKNEIYKPGVFEAFVNSVETGEFDSVYPMAVKEKTFNPAMTWIQAYQMALGKVGTKTPAVTEPPAAATPPKQQEKGRHMSGQSAADRVWNDPDYFAKLDAEIFS